MPERLAAFAYLAESVPAWIKSLEELQARMQERQAEVARVAVPVVQAPKIKRTSSNESIRYSNPTTSSPSTGFEIKSAPAQQVHTTPQTTRTAAMPSLAMDSPILSRKRKTMSLVSAASGTHKYRSRATLTIYYDSNVQDAFEKLVRNISAGRNQLRKARMADRLTGRIMGPSSRSDSAVAGARTPTLRTVRSASGMPSYDQFIQERLHSRGNLGIRPPTTPLMMHDSVGPQQKQEKGTVVDARDTADTALDRAQNMCEKGAHQFLRDGDCNEEIDGARAAFKEVLEIAWKEIKRVEEEEKDKQRQELEEQLEKEEEQRRRSSVGADVVGKRDSLSTHPALMHSVGIIEADDDDDDDDGDSDEDYDDPALLPSPPFRLMART